MSTLFRVRTTHTNSIFPVDSGFQKFKKEKENQVQDPSSDTHMNFLINLFIPRDLNMFGAVSCSINLHSRHSCEQSGVLRPVKHCGYIWASTAVIKTSLEKAIKQVRLGRWP